VEWSGRPDVLMTSLTQSGEAYIWIALPKREGDWLQMWANSGNGVINNNKVVPLS